jgi:hypothetical protein
MLDEYLYRRMYRQEGHSLMTFGRHSSALSAADLQTQLFYEHEYFVGMHGLFCRHFIFLQPNMCLYGLWTKIRSDLYIYFVAKFRCSDTEV